MARARYAKMLSDRRKQLRLSIPQAAKVLRMRESVLEAFEEGDFDRLPPLGYAQGMVASYARYLGLDSRHLTELYEREHEQYVSEVTGRETFGLARLSDEPSNRGPASAASAPRPLRSASSSEALRAAGLEGSASRPTGAAASASAYQTGAAALRGSSYRVTQGRGEPVPYAPQGSGRHDTYGQGGRTSYGEGRAPGDRRYTTRVPEDDDRSRRRQAATVRRARYGEGERGSGRGRQDRYDAGAGDITTRRVSSGRYRDDMRYDDDVRPYRPSSTRAGRQASRSAVPPERPNVRRRQAPPADRDPRTRGRRREPQQTGLAGILQAFLSDPRRVMLVIALSLAVILALIISFSVRSCASSSGETKQVPVVTASTTSSATTAATVSETEQQALSEAAQRAAASSAAAASQETVVTVSVADGATSWVEITSDGTQAVAESVTGPWSQDFTVTKSISIQVADSSAVTVEKNGERVQLTKTSGSLASVTIQGSDPSAATTASETSSATTTSAKTTASKSSSKSGSSKSGSSSN